MAEPGTGALAAIAESGARQTRRLALLLVAVNVLLPIYLYVVAQIEDEPLWWSFSGERHHANWLSSVQCLIVGLVAWAVHVAAATSRRLGSGPAPRHAWIWPVFCLGFWFLTVDERFHFGALVEKLAGSSLGEDPAAWRAWYAENAESAAEGATPD